MRAKKEEFDVFFQNMNKRGNDFQNIKNLIASNEGNNFFLGVRENYPSIYYMGMSIASVNAIKKGGGCSYSVSYFYLKGVKDLNGNKPYDDKSKGYFSLSSDVFWEEENFKQILKNVRKHVLGYGELAHVYLEKACQQWIINNNNSNPKSNWYYVDMEYIYKEDGQKSDHPFGRADIIAISKKPDKNGVFSVAFVELKVGTGAYGISIKVPDSIKDKEKRSEYREQVKNYLGESLWREEVIGVKLGSGLASHVVDFMHFFSDDKATAQLRKEIVGIINVHKQFGLINENLPLYFLESDNQINPITDIYIVTYSKTPEIEKNMLSELAQSKYEESTLEEMKLEFAKYFYKIPGASSLPIETLINARDISGLIELKQDYLKFMNSDDNQIECVQHINNIPHRFVYRFIDLNNAEANPVECIV